jgi:hypothetical protein
MKMNDPEKRYIVSNSQTAKALMALYGVLAANNTLYYGSPDYDASITQQAIDGAPEFEGLEKARLDGSQSVQSNIFNLITAALPDLTVLANLT